MLRTPLDKLRREPDPGMFQEVYKKCVLKWKVQRLQWRREGSFGGRHVVLCSIESLCVQDMCRRPGQVLSELMFEEEDSSNRARSVLNEARVTVTLTLHTDISHKNCRPMNLAEV